MGDAVGDVKYQNYGTNTDINMITGPDVRECMSGSIKLGKTDDLNGLAAEHFVHSRSSICVHLLLLFSSLSIKTLELCFMKLIEGYQSHER